jgi:hypothetical protein
VLSPQPKINLVNSFNFNFIYLNPVSSFL